MSVSYLSRRGLTIWIAGGLIAVLGTRQAFVSAFASRAPDAVAAVKPSDAKVVVGSFDRALMSEGTRFDAAKWADGARRVLRDAPLTSGAARMLALGATGSDAPRRLMALAERISRRDLLVQLWHIEDAVRREDIGEALRHYDRALSVYPGARSQLFGILAAAMDEPEVRRELAPYVQQDRPWAYDFVGYAIDNAPSPVQVADLLARSGGSRAVARHRPLETALLMKLVSRGEPALARRYASEMAKGGTSDIESFGFSERTLDPELRPFSWGIADDARVTTRLDSEGTLDVVVPPGISGQAATRVVVLRPGRWTMTQTVELPSFSPMAAGTWTATCVGGKEPLQFWSQSLPLRPGRKTYRSSFDVPAICEAVQFQLNIRGDDSQVEAQIGVGGLQLAQRSRPLAADGLR